MSATASKKTTDHEEIKRWADRRGGRPTVVKGTVHGDTGLLRIDFSGYSNESTLKEISWDEFFQKFDDERLQFVYQEKTVEGTISRINRFIAAA
jgi:hypothetical protein